MSRHLRHFATAATLFVLAAGLLGAPAADAAPAPTSDLLLPYFEVQLDGPGLITLFAVVNSSRQEVPVEIVVHSNWGIELLRVPLVLKAEQVQSVNLRDWLVVGDLPGDEDLSAEDLAHLQAALSGEESPRDGQYYSSQIAFGRAVGYVTIRSQASRPDVLFGDYFVVDSPQDFAQGEQLVNIDPADRCGSGICMRHALRFLEGAAFNAGTELIIWTQRRVQPTTAPLGAEAVPVVLDATAFEEPGSPLGERFQGLLPVQVLRVADLNFDQPFGWLDLTTSEESFIAVRYSAADRYSVALNSVCLPLELPPAPGLTIEKSTNGLDADQAPGVTLAVGTEITWEYLVRNTGDVALSDIVVTDDDPSLTVLCPGDTLAAGESMVCTATGEAGQCGYVNVGSVSGLTADGTRLSDTDRSHYFGNVSAALAVELSVNGHDADQGPGPVVGAGDALSFVAEVTNTGVSDLDGVEVTSAGLDFSCPRDSLAAGESMTCTAEGVAEAGSHAVEANARGEDACGAMVADDDPTHYSTGCVESAPALAVEKATNGHDSDFAPGQELPVGTPITWSYVVTNTGGTALSDVAVTDDDASLSVSCPKDALAPGESMTCTAHGAAEEGPYANLGTASGVSECGQAVSDSDPSHYTGKEEEEGDQGCTPGYWKNHTDSWPPTGYAPGQSVQSVFAAAGAYPAIGSASLLEALGFNGGSGVEGAARNLLRAATAALLDASHPGVDYPRSAAGVIADADAALASGDRDTMLALAAAFDADNNLGCPLN